MFFLAVVLATLYCENNDSYIRNVLWLILLNDQEKDYSGFKNKFQSENLKKYYILQIGKHSLKHWTLYKVKKPLKEIMEKV